MEHLVLRAAPRNVATKGELNKNRREGRIPAVIYGGGKPAQSIFVYTADYEKILKHITESTIITIDLEGKKIDAFVKDHQRDPVEKNLLHVDFLEVQAGKKLHAKVEIKLNGIPKGVRDGGILETLVHDIEVECDPSALPERIEVDISNMEANQPLYVRDLPPMKDVRVLASPDMVVATVKFARQEVEAASAAEAAPAAEAGATATGETQSAGDAKASGTAEAKS
ncbi:MAG TPA: 50S ribosomal protein L25 [Spirochaetales bacterium]|nr:50S ribosomal protein L25 [Spirochaetales bacterium]HPS15067.1 50S ribosomal protein L25 [Spirochaetales bacterium]